MTCIHIIYGLIELATFYLLGPLIVFCLVPSSMCRSASGSIKKAESVYPTAKDIIERTLMPSPEVINLGYEAIADHAFNSDHSLLAVARNNIAELYYDLGNSFEFGAALKGHDRKVTAVDINSQNEIVTCSQDRNAYVWKAQSDGSWKPTLVLLRINRAATSVKWSPNGLKFAVGTGARVIAVSYYDEPNDWWISKHIKKPLKSTVLSIDWHPNSVLLASGSTDGHARVFSGYIKGVDTRPEPSAWGERLPFQTLCFDYVNDSQAWVDDVAFSPSGNALAWATHDSSIFVAYPSGPDQPPLAVHEIDAVSLPYQSLVWTTESQLVAGGFDCFPVVYEGSQSGWKLARNLDDPKSHKDRGQATEQSAMHMFRELDLKGTQNESTLLPTIHQNAIRTVRYIGTNYKGKSGPPKVSTSGDGKVVIFSV